MMISVKVVARAKREKIEKQPDGSYKVWVRTVPEKGKANGRVLELLAVFFDRPKQSLRIAKGETSNKKLVEFV